ncbi:hypothetical protein U1Q18_015210 [Sarracenia purpurea var. burkii]
MCPRLPRAMGRDVAGLRIDKKPNAVKVDPNGAASNDTVHVSPKIASTSDQTKGQANSDFVALFFSRAMEKDVPGLRIDKKPNAIKVDPNGAVSNDTVHVSPKIATTSDQTKGYEAENHTLEDSLPKGLGQEKKDSPSPSVITSGDAWLPEGKPSKKLDPPLSTVDNNKLSSPVKGNVQAKDASWISTPVIDKQVSTETPTVVVETVDAGGHCSTKANESHSHTTAEKSQVSSQLQVLSQEALILAWPSVTAEN